MRAGMMVMAAVLCLGMGQARTAEMTFAVAGNGGSCMHCTWMSAQGEITLASHEKLKAFAKKNGVGDIYLNSQGGSIEGAILLGRAFRELGFSTDIGRTVSEPTGEWRKDLKSSQCTGACALAFAGGVTRELSDPQSKLGRLPFGVAISGRETKNTADPAVSRGETSRDTEILAYVLDMGLDPHALLPASNNVPVYTADELKALKIIWHPPMLSEWRVEPFQQGAVAVSEGEHGDPSLSLYCEGGHRKLLYSLKKPADSLIIGYEETQPYSFAGAEIPVDKIDFRPTEGHWRAYLTLPDDFVPVVVGEEASLSNDNDSPPGRGISITFSTKGLVSSALIAFRRCI